MTTETGCRRPTNSEQEQLIESHMKEYGVDREGCAMDGAYIAIFDHYITDGPGFAGKLAVVVYGGSPDYVQSWCFDSDLNTWVLAGDYKDEPSE